MLLDVQLPDQDGFALADILATDEQPPIVVLISSRDRGAYRFKLAATPPARFFQRASCPLQAFDEAVSA